MTRFIFILTFVSSLSPLYALIRVTDSLTISGFLRTRFWYIYNQTSLPQKVRNNAKDQISYQDIFFRNRIRVKPLSKIEIWYISDISSVFGRSNNEIIETIGGQLGKPGFNLITRNLFLKFKPKKTWM